MKNIFKNFAFLLLTAVFFQSCTSNESDEELVSDELTITTELADKITATATSLNDVNFLEKYAANACGNIYISGYFRNPQGYNSEYISLFEEWSLPEFYAKKQAIIQSTGIDFTNDDFFLSFITTPDPDAWTENRLLYNRKSYLDYFDDCNYEEEESSYNNIYIPLSEFNFNCNNGAIVIYSLQSSFFLQEPLDSGLTPIENKLITYNSEHNTSFTLDDITIDHLLYPIPDTTNIFEEQKYVLLQEEKDILNYFSNCSLARDINDNDCLNFVYPLQINRTNQQTNEVITLENDEDLTTSFNANTNVLSFVFPISLLGQDGTVLTIDTNEALEIALDNSATYCE